MLQLFWRYRPFRKFTFDVAFDQFVEARTILKFDGNETENKFSELYTAVCLYLHVI